MLNKTAKKKTSTFFTLIGEAEEKGVIGNFITTPTLFKQTQKYTVQLPLGSGGNHRK